MNPELQKALAWFLAEATKAAGAVGSQIPPTLQEIVVYGRIWETTAAVIVLALLAVSAFVFVASLKTPAVTLDEDDARVMVLAVSGFFAAFFLLIFVFSVRDALMAWFAPSVYIIKWLASKVK